MKTVLALALAFGALASAEDRDRAVPPDQEQQQQGDEGRGDNRRLESVTWNVRTHKLVWVVQDGADVDGRFVSSGSESYEISPDDAVMAVEQEKRGFTVEEAKSLHRLLDVLSLYCAESVVWWDAGQGTPLDNDGAPTQTPKDQPDDGGAKPRRVEQPQPRTNPRPLNVALLKPKQ
jgi:hypothetical protein